MKIRFLKSQEVKEWQLATVQRENRITFIGYYINLTSHKILLIYLVTSELKYALQREL